MTADAYGTAQACPHAVLAIARIVASNIGHAAGGLVERDERGVEQLGRCGSLPLSMTLSRRRMASNAASLLFAADFTCSYVSPEGPPAEPCGSAFSTRLSRSSVTATAGCPGAGGTSAGSAAGCSAASTVVSSSVKTVMLDGDSMQTRNGVCQCNVVPVDAKQAVQGRLVTSSDSLPPP
jgi:hypothetical protein